MQQDEIIAMAREAEIALETMVLLCGVEIQVTASPLSVDELARFAARVAAKERDACVQVCVAISADYWMGDAQFEAATRCSNAIRARGTKESA